MPDARDDRQRKLCDVGAEAVGVEAVEIAARSAAADQHHGVELPEAFGYGAERPDDRLLGRGPLHEGVEQREVKAVGALPELLAEVLVTGCIGARDDGHALYDGGHGLLAVHLPDTVALQLGDGHLPLPLHVAQRVGRVDVGDLQREAVEFVVIYQHTCQDPDAGLEPLPRLGLEVAGDAGVVRAPDDGPGLGRGDSVVTALLDQFEVAVARVVYLDLGDLGTDPQGQGEAFVEGLPDQPLQFAQGDMSLRVHHPSRMPRVMRVPKSMMLRAVSPRQTLSSSPWSMRTILRQVAMCAAA